MLSPERSHMPDDIGSSGTLLALKFGERDLQVARVPEDDGVRRTPPRAIEAVSPSLPLFPQAVVSRSDFADLEVRVDS